MIEFLRSPWGEVFEQLVHCARSSLVISSPYVGREPCDKLVGAARLGQKAGRFSLLLLTDLSRHVLLTGATDVSAIADLVAQQPGAEIRFLPSVHAKIYVADDSVAVVTSANMTTSGLYRNFEYGVRITSADAVRRIRRDVMAYAALGTQIDEQRLRFLACLSAELNQVRTRAESSTRRQLRAEFRRRLKQFDDELLRTRAAGRTAHAIFADAILYLLAQRPMRTADLHPLIHKIHPDLCDDAEDRVIDGRHFGKKWKHAVRTAQQHLRRRGLVQRKGRLWHLVSQ